jgi:hypothetical protein
MKQQDALRDMQAEMDGNAGARPSRESLACPKCRKPDVWMFGGSAKFQCRPCDWTGTLDDIPGYTSTVANDMGGPRYPDQGYDPGQDHVGNRPRIRYRQRPGRSR